MITKEEAIKIATHDDMEAILAYEYKNKWIVAIKPIGADDDHLLMDPYKAVDKITGELTGWNPRFEE